MLPKLASLNATMTALFKSTFGIRIEPDSFSIFFAFLSKALASSSLCTTGSAIFWCASLTSKAICGIVS